MRENYEGFKQILLKKSEDGCHRKPKRGFDMKRYYVDAGVKVTSFSVASNTTLGLEAAPTGFPIQVNANLKTLKNIEFLYSLPSPNNYKLFSKKFPKFWESEPIN